eukprot:COSAG05_NODE_145_length_16478_cov_15.287197_2_plen_104_part_00
MLQQTRDKSCQHGNLTVGLVNTGEQAVQNGCAPAHALLSSSSSSKVNGMSSGAAPAWYRPPPPARQGAGRPESKAPPMALSLLRASILPVAASKLAIAVDRSL